MTTAVVIPYRGGDPDRDRALEWVLDHYRSNHPWPAHVADCDGRWSKGAAVANAIEHTDTDSLVIADADSWTGPQVLSEAVRLVESGDAHWVVPHARVYRQSCQATRLIYDEHPPSRSRLARRPYDAVPGGGITVVRRDIYEQVPIDPRFYDWGGEDFCWAWALDTIIGPCVQLGGDLFHLWHPHPSPNYDKPPESEALKAQYQAARRHPARMRAVVADEAYTTPTPLAKPRRFRSATTPRTLTCGPDKVRFVDHHFETRDPDLAEAVLRFANVKEV